jgi:hypothetical protein
VRTTKVIGVAAVAVLVALVAGAVVLAATGNATTTVPASSVVVGAGPPTTATVELTYASSNGISITADGALDFANDAADVSATASLSIVTATVEARLSDRTLYLHVPQFASLVGAPWVSTGQLGGPSRLDELAAAMRHPDLARLHPKRRTVVRTSGGTVTTMSFGAVHLPSTAGLPVTLPSVAVVTATVVTGTQGQLLSAAALLVSHGQTVKLTLRVTGYNAPVHVTAPPASDVVVLTGARERAIFGTNAPGIARALRGLRGVLAGGR